MIIGYIHICQKEGWKKSFDILIDAIKKSNLYQNITEIRCGIVNDVGTFIDDDRFHDSKIKIIHVNTSEQYERPTLLHMRIQSDIDPIDTKYFYLHTKGIRHFNTTNEEFVLEWINTMLYWNIDKWDFAVDKLNEYDTYGCYYNGTTHYSGNFWWARSSHIQKLPTIIESYYTAPEDWILKIKENLYCCHNFAPEWFNNMMSMYRGLNN